MKDTYRSYIDDFASLITQALPVPDGGARAHKGQPERLKDNKCALILSPHPDDECLTGGLPLRLKREAAWQVINVAVTLGSKPERKKARYAELSCACGILGFEVVESVLDSFAFVPAEARVANIAAWRAMVERVTELIKVYEPELLVIPHAHDLHPAHMGTHDLGMEALGSMPANFTCHIALTEYWHPQEEPNCMVGLGVEDAATLLKALCCHEGENERNAFHKRFPAYLIDNVRRGSERVGGVGSSGAAMEFAMLYRIGLWQAGKLVPNAAARTVGPQSPITDILGC